MVTKTGAGVFIDVLFAKKSGFFLIDIFFFLKTIFKLASPLSLEMLELLSAPFHSPKFWRRRPPASSPQLSTIKMAFVVVCLFYCCVNPLKLCRSWWSVAFLSVQFVQNATSKHFLTPHVCTSSQMTITRTASPISRPDDLMNVSPVMRIFIVSTDGLP